MKNNTNKLMVGLALTALTIAGLSSCKKENNEKAATENLNADVVVKNGMLSFSSQQKFDETISKLQKLSLKDAEGIISKYGIKSLALDTANGKQPVVNVIDPVFARLLNSDASLIVGDKIFVLKGNNEYLVNNLDFDLYKQILSADNYFANNDKVYSKDVSANYKTTEMNVKSQLGGQTDLKSVNDGGKLAVGEVGGSGQVTVVSGGFQGTIYHYSQEFNSTGRPERVYCAISGQINAINTSYGMYMQGQVFRKGGAFGGKEWRDDAIAWGRIYFVGGNFGADLNVQGPATDTNFAYAFNQPHNVSLSLGWQYKKGYSDPTETFTHTIVIQ
ncbi:hypothetical protein [Pedobacter nototheniae]|uniref:hypothetical protein n=1 Tax=Pedobacter nototheniae TaxID=2488994 RepID=UPI0029301F54|nr:hypothetical protein [Pedobacter nototheniae]